ncbi:MAG: hypothetical protein J4215_04320 [Candidatus Diapherotrites archaeon]|uniref:Uncharacterized protein n=1 Tax=Candidatus Iainarchaeum sp. TaxID=3101447 RepID=A0A8T4L366_9ARCH|nr:hypothetical protein [Candidatus Diapherotrites archaeon]
MNRIHQPPGPRRTKRILKSAKRQQKQFHARQITGFSRAKISTRYLGNKTPDDKKIIQRLWQKNLNSKNSALALKKRHLIEYERLREVFFAQGEWKQIYTTDTPLRQIMEYVRTHYQNHGTIPAQPKIATHTGLSLQVVRQRIRRQYQRAFVRVRRKTSHGKRKTKPISDKRRE